MARTKQTTRQNSLVIVCEGSDTENQYFIDMALYVQEKRPDSFDNILVLPTKKEKAGKNPNRQHLVRKMQNPSAAQWQYYLAKESCQADYDTYRSQPTRYVREAQLLMREGGYTEGWAVYDNDGFPDHDNARKVAAGTPGLHIAYSSISFEEWILCHFERNDTRFLRSECSANCGTGKQGDCHGSECVAGRIRERRYISDWKKSKPKVFEHYTLPLLDHALLNAAWLRSLEPTVAIPLRNPYTDVDALVMRLLGQEKEVLWIREGVQFQMFGGSLTVGFSAQGITITHHGQNTVVITIDALQYCDERGNPVQSALQRNIILDASNRNAVISSHPKAKLLLFRSIERGVRKEVYVELK